MPEKYVDSKITKKVIELARVSTEGQSGPDRAGLAAQRASNKQTAARYGLKIVDSTEISDVSGAAVLRSPQMQKLLRMIESPDIHGVVAREFSRLMRPENFGDYALLQAFADTGTILYLPDGPIDFSSKSGRLFGTIRAAFAGSERREILDRMHEAKETIRRAGKHPGGKSSLPFGVEYSPKEGWKYTAEAEKVKRAFALLLSGNRNYVEIARQLNIPRSSLRYILENPIYTGWRVYDEQRDPSAAGYVARPDGRQGYRRKIQRATEEVIRVRVLDSLVSEQDFKRAQYLIETKRTKYWRGRIGIPERYTFNGFLKCGECGERLYTHTTKYEFYICKTRNTRERRKRALLGLEPCDNKYMLRHKLEPRIDSLIGKKLQDSTFLTKILQAYRKRLESSTAHASLDFDQAAVATKLESLEAKRARVLDAFFEGLVNRAKRDEMLQEVDREISTYNVLQSTTSVGPQPESLPTVDAMLQMIEPLAEWEFLSRDDRRSLLLQLCPEISVYKYTVKSLTLNLGPTTEHGSGYIGSHPKMAR